MLPRTGLPGGRGGGGGVPRVGRERLGHGVEPRGRRRLHREVAPSRITISLIGMPDLEFRARTRLVTGLGCVERRLGDELRALDAGTIAVVADRGFADAGLLDAMLAPVSGVTCGCARSSASTRPRRGGGRRRAAEEAGADAVLAVGGGSALCAAKAVAMRLRNPAPLDAYEGRDRLPSLPAPTRRDPDDGGLRQRGVDRRRPPRRRPGAAPRRARPRLRARRRAARRQPPAHAPRAAARAGGARRLEPRARGALGARRHALHGHARPRRGGRHPRALPRASHARTTRCRRSWRPARWRTSPAATPGSGSSTP